MFQFTVILSVLCTALQAEILLAGPKHVPVFDERIVGGEPTTILAIPWQVSLRRNGRHFCGGAIISESIVITAAHCVQDLSNTIGISILAGSTYLTAGGVPFAIAKMVIHPNFAQFPMDSDIAVLFLDGILPFSDAIAPIALAEPNEVLIENTVALVSGWGVLSEAGSVSNVLRAVEVNIVDQEKCEIAYNNIDKITNTMICASRDGKDACQGDSGGPLVVNNKLYGVVSWGVGCARPEYPGVYAYIPSLRPWLNLVFELN